MDEKWANVVLDALDFDTAGRLEAFSVKYENDMATQHTHNMY